MFGAAEVKKAVATGGDGLQAAVEALDPASLDPAGTIELLDGFDRIERLAAAGKALIAARIDTDGLWRGTGARDGVGYVAARTCDRRGRVRDAIGVAGRLGEMPVLDTAVRSGGIGLEQAADIAAAVATQPEAESELVELAGQVTPRQLKERCLAIMAEGEGAEDQHRRAKADRACSSRVGRDAVWRLNASLPVVDGAVVDKALDHFQTQAFDAARLAGEREPFTAYRADALVAMARAALSSADRHGTVPLGHERDAATDVAASAAEGGDGHREGRRRRGAPRAGSTALRHTIVVTVPHATLLGTDPTGGESCQVPGVGPVPASVVRRLLAEGDPIVKAVVTRGRDITACATLTRTIKDDLRLAVLMANEHRCAVPGCDSNRFLELDHAQPFADGGATSFENLRPLCSWHHDRRTNDGYELRGSPGSYRWVGPDGTELAAERAAVPS